MSSSVKIDFRKFVSYMRKTEEGAFASTQDPELRKLIYQDIANSGLIFAKGEDTGATEGAISAVQQGFGTAGDAYTNSKGITRYAYSSISKDGIYIDPVDEKGRHYGQYSVANLVSEYSLNFGRGSDTYGIYNEIYKIIRAHILMGG